MARKKFAPDEQKSYLIKESLIKEAKLRNMDQEFYLDMIDDYICLFNLKSELQYDIQKHGIKTKVQTGNGFKVTKDNPSVQNLLKVNTQMLKILSDLNLKDTNSKLFTLGINEGDEDDDLLQRD